MNGDPLHPFGGSPLLEVADLEVVADKEDGTVVPILRGLQLIVPEKRRVGIVGESGSGKSMTVSAILGVFPAGVHATQGHVLFSGHDLRKLDQSALRAIRGREVSVVFQNAVASLHPLISVGDQISNVCRAHLEVTKREASARAVEMLDSLGIPNAQSRAQNYPHQFSGGMAQRVAIAMALICGPSLLIADEPTTGLDATIQAQVLEVIEESTRSREAALLLISHDLSVIQAMCDIVAVFYAGELMEFGFARDVLGTPLSPYTDGLVRCLAPEDGEPVFIPGRIPEPGTVGAQCPFVSRCALASDACRQQRAPLRELRPNHWVACHNAS